MIALSLISIALLIGLVVAFHIISDLKDNIDSLWVRVDDLEGEMPDERFYIANNCRYIPFIYKEKNLKAYCINNDRANHTCIVDADGDGIGTIFSTPSVKESETDFLNRVVIPFLNEKL